MGFETMANLGEEVEHPRTNLPRGIVLAVVASLVLYVAVAVAAVLAGSPPDSPLLGLFEGHAAGAFALLGAVAISNGVLVEIMMLARLFYGLANAGQLPRVFAGVNQRTRTPVRATVAAGIVVLAAALALPFAQLLALSNALTLAVFVLVDLALWRVHRMSRVRADHFIAPRWVPLSGAVLSALLIAAEAVR
jgi:amino acid transporter